MHYVVVYAKGEGNLLDVTPFADATAALDARFRTERAHRADRNVEVVVLSGESRAAIERTHGRYFHRAKELLGAFATEPAGAARLAY